MDITPLTNALIALLAGVISIMGGIALQAVARWLHVQVSQAQASAFDSALSKALSYAAVQCAAQIKANGWDHVETHNQVVQIALQVMLSKFPQASAGVGISDTAGGRCELAAALQRALPATFAMLAASPATPPVNTAPVPAAA